MKKNFSKFPIRLSCLYLLGNTLCPGLKKLMDYSLLSLEGFPFYFFLSALEAQSDVSITLDLILDEKVGYAPANFICMVTNAAANLRDQ